MNEDLFHVMALAQHQFDMAYDLAIYIQKSSKNGIEIKEAWDAVHQKELRFKKAFDDYIRYMQEMEAEFV